MHCLRLHRDFFSLVIAAFFLASCSTEEETPAMPHQKLSEYEFFTGEMKNLQPGNRVLPYDLNTPLFSDYSFKARFIYLPEGTHVDYTASGTFDFPEGAILIKNFYYPDDFRNPVGVRKIIETRLLLKLETGWESATYLWNDAQDEAELTLVGKQENIAWLDENGNPKSTDYIVPNKNDCKGCHSFNNELIPIGPKARNMNRSFDYADGAMNQLDKWLQKGFLSGLSSSASAPVLPDWHNPNTGSLEQRARAYLDVNCAHCHNPNGPADNSALSLDYSETNPTLLGICKPPVAAGQGSGGLKYSIVPGKPQESIMIYRMSSVQPAVAMPELGKTLAHDEGVLLISDWIAAMTGSCQ